MPAPRRGQANAMRLPLPVGTVQEFAGADTVHSGVSSVDKSLVDANAGRLPSWRSASGAFVKQGEDSPRRAGWLREPLAYSPATAVDDEDLLDRLNAIFRDAFDHDIIPTLTDVACAAGYSSIVQMTNDARRKGPERMRHISRTLSAIQSYYERLALEGNKVALELLRTIPQFDALESAEQIATRAFAPTPHEVVVTLAGMERQADRGRDLSPLDAYNQLIAEPTFMDISNAVQLVADEDGVFGLPLAATRHEVPQPQTTSPQSQTEQTDPEPQAQSASSTPAPDAPIEEGCGLSGVPIANNNPHPTPSNHGRA